VSVSGFHGFDDGGSHLFVVQRPGSQSDLGNPVSVIELNHW
jgi:hypothetical protein